MPCSDSYAQAREADQHAYECMQAFCTLMRHLDRHPDLCVDLPPSVKAAWKAHQTWDKTR